MKIITETLAMLEQMDRYNRLKRESQTEDRATVMAALKACGITKVVIRYDGYGDSGGVEECTVEGGHTLLDVATVAELRAAYAARRQPLSVAQDALRASPQALAA